MSIIADIKRHEGYSKKVYKDTLGYDTIGIGFLVSSLELDEDVCDIILERRLIKNERVLERKLLFYKDLPQPVKNILQNISLGNESNIGFKLLANEKNDPFESAWFDFQTGTSPKLEIIYVAN